MSNTVASLISYRKQQFDETREDSRVPRSVDRHDSCEACDL